MILACSSKLRIMTLRLFGENCMPMLLLILEMFAQVPEEQLGVYRFVESEPRGFQEEALQNFQQNFQCEFFFA